jgi:glutamyl-tRNA reductase
VIDQLVIVNLRREARDKMPAVINGVEWQTCLRRILFLNARDNHDILQTIETENLLPPLVEVFRGQQAYGYLLEVICGLNSPIVGETAVMGQFKEFLQNAKFPNSSWGNLLRQLATNLMIDAKRVRSAHLQRIGSQSYGSLVRQQVKGLPEVAVLGSGKLAREILPWLIGKTKIRVFCRDLERANYLREEFPEIDLIEYSNTSATWNHREAGLVIAAPLAGEDVARWVQSQQASFTKCLDLRGEALKDPVNMHTVLIPLHELFAALRAERERLEGHVEAARAEIKRLVAHQTQQAQFRPFGWEDLCA